MFAYVPVYGYVGIGRVIGEMILARDAKAKLAGELRSLLEVPEASPKMKNEMGLTDLELATRVVPVEWLDTRSLDEAVWEKGLFASQWTACKLRDERTIATVEAAFGIGESTI